MQGISDEIVYRSGLTAKKEEGSTETEGQGEEGEGSEGSTGGEEWSSEEEAEEKYATE